MTWPKWHRKQSPWTSCPTEEREKSVPVGDTASTKESTSLFTSLGMKLYDEPVSTAKDASLAHGKSNC